MPIQILPARLANQIAAGEVVERPASVIKELVENALDAGATRIDIEVQKGGSKLIRIRDNGCGIAKDELTLALSRHATSKVSSFDDLENITSLGFRGEALASISSVSRLKLTSRPENQSEAWQAYAEGRDMAVKVIPAAHPQGTTIEVVDLFFNTPARRKFLRTEKTEFYHIDELIKRIALSRFDVNISLQHNDKMVRQFRRADNPQSKSKRLGLICGRKFEQGCVEIFCELDEVTIGGWIGLPHSCTAQADVQYTYVNGRMMRDKLINHAIRQAYSSFIDGQLQAGFVLYLTVDPKQVDVNVHPAKHEVRFHQARLIHDFIVHAIEQGLSQAVQPVMADANQIPLDEYPAEPLSPQQQTQDLFTLSSEQHSESSGDFTAERDSKPASVEGIGTSSYQNQVSENSHSTYQADAWQSHKSSNSHFAGKAGTLNQRQFQNQNPSASELKAYHHALSHFTQLPDQANECENISKAADSVGGDGVNKQNQYEQAYSVPPLTKAHEDTPAQNNDNSRSGQKIITGMCLSVINGHFALYQQEDRVFLLDLRQVNGKVAALQYCQGLIGQPLLLPVKLLKKQLDTQVSLLWLENSKDWFATIGIDYECLKDGVVIRKVPAILRQNDVSVCVERLFAAIKAKSDDTYPTLDVVDGVQIVYDLFAKSQTYDLLEANKLIAQLLTESTEQIILQQFAVEIDLAHPIDDLNAKSNNEIIK